MQFRSRFDGPWADPETLASVRTGDWRQKRPFRRPGRCTHCGLCYLYCPNGCIRERFGHFETDLNFCKGCGLCAYICPLAVIVMVAEEAA